MTVFTKRQIDIMKGLIPYEDVSPAELSDIEQICIERDCSQIALDLFNRYKKKGYSPYTERQLKIMAMSARGITKEEVRTLIYKVQKFEGVDTAGDLFEKYEEFLTGVSPHEKDYLPIEEAASILDGISHWKTNWHLGEVRKEKKEVEDNIAEYYDGFPFYGLSDDYDEED